MSRLLEDCVCVLLVSSCSFILCILDTFSYVLSARPSVHEGELTNQLEKKVGRTPNEDQNPKSRIK